MQPTVRVSSENVTATLAVETMPLLIRIDVFTIGIMKFRKNELKAQANVTFCGGRIENSSQRYIT